MPERGFGRSMTDLTQLSALSEAVLDAAEPDPLDNTHAEVQAPPEPPKKEAVEFDDD